MVTGTEGFHSLLSLILMDFQNVNLIKHDRPAERKAKQLQLSGEQYILCTQTRGEASYCRVKRPIRLGQVEKIILPPYVRNDFPQVLLRIPAIGHCFLLLRQVPKVSAVYIFMQGNKSVCRYHYTSNGQYIDSKRTISTLLHGSFLFIRDTRNIPSDVKHYNSDTDFPVLHYKFS